MADTKISGLPASTTPLAGTEVLPVVQGGATKQVSVANLTAGRAVDTGKLTVTNATGGSTASNYLVVKGSTADNSNYPSIELQGGTLYQATRAPKMSLANAGLGVGLYAGYMSSVYTAQYGIYMDSSIGLQLQSSASGAPTTKLSIGTGNDVTLPLGNLVIGTSGKGIDFSATSSGSGTMTSELLADYEEGNWSPEYKTDGTNFASITMDTSCKYTKIGRQVNVSGFIRTDAINVVGATGNVYVDLPFTPNTSAGEGISNSYEFAANYPSSVYCDANSTRLYLMYKLALNSQDVNVHAADLMNGTNKNQIFLSFTYFTAS